MLFEAILDFHVIDDGQAVADVTASMAAASKMRGRHILPQHFLGFILEGVPARRQAPLRKILEKNRIDRFS